MNFPFDTDRSFAGDDFTNDVAGDSHAVFYHPFY